MISDLQIARTLSRDVTHIFSVTSFYADFRRVFLRWAVAVTCKRVTRQAGVFHNPSMQVLKQSPTPKSLRWSRFALALLALPLVLGMAWEITVLHGFAPVVAWPRILAVSAVVVWLMAVLLPTQNNPGQVLRMLYLFAVFPYLLWYVELPFVAGPFPLVEFGADYGLQLLLALTLTWAFTLAWQLPKSWQRWGASAGFVALALASFYGVQLLLQR